ncbi:MAG: alcohol dehydrogenase [Bacillota bacterium]|jgi:alcohol dehydrogenase|nr:alcohol dehydrogenase [Bacillota bacterium]HOA90156.1 alcohol dehydrogenase [Bacillota bacterium]HOP53486.1 alcohol dehydrogenase [Bacillota bacterium]HPT61518.1 alcohol dehydrogenase [Bacillota bacterium]HPZ74072.1 alcohol dehydrogenase [Bacillota bacterium]
MSTMKAFVYHGPEKMSLDIVPKPKIQKPTDAIVKVTTSTICGTDKHIRHGGLPEVEPGRIIGHEFCGIVEEVGPAVTRFKPGDRVAVSCVTQCMECYYCRRGMYSQCVDGSWIFGYMIDGCQADYVRVPYADSGMHLIPEELEDEDVLFVGDILSTGYFGAENGKIQPGDTVAVFGSGPVGMCAMATARLFGPATIVAVDIDDSRLEFAKKNGWADVGLNPNKVDVPQALRDMTEGRGADVTIEANGFEPTFKGAINSVRPGGTVSIIGVFEKPQIVEMNKLWIKNITIAMGLVNANRIPELINLIKAGKIDMRPLITHTLPLSQVAEAYDIFEERRDGAIKVVLKADA